MLTQKTYTPAPSPEAVPILPQAFTPEVVRWLALVMAVRLRVARQSLEHGRSIEKASGGRAAPVSISGENERNLFNPRSARSLRLAENGREFVAISPTTLNPATTRAADIETITTPLSEANRPSARTTTAKNPPSPVHSTQVELTQPPRV